MNKADKAILNGIASDRAKPPYIITVCTPLEHDVIVASLERAALLYTECAAEPNTAGTELLENCRQTAVSLATRFRRGGAERS